MVRPLPTAVGADCAAESVGVCAHAAVREDSSGPGAVVGCNGRVVIGGVGYLHEGIDEGVAVVGDLNNVGLDIRGVERLWCLWGIRDVGVLILSRVRIRLAGGMTGGCVSAGSGSKGLVECVVDLCDEPGGLGFFVGDGGGRFTKRRYVVVVGCGRMFLVRVGCGRLPGAFAVASIEKVVGGGDSVVLVGVVAALADVVQQVDKVLPVVGAGEYLVG